MPARTGKAQLWNEIHSEIRADFGSRKERPGAGRDLLVSFAEKLERGRIDRACLDSGFSCTGL
jgi:hypothetical protein